MAESMTTRFVSVSGGKDSTAMALRLREVEPDTDFRFICTPTGNELPDMIEHWDRLGSLLGKPLERITHPLEFFGLIEAEKMLPSHHSRWCTRMLKIEPAIALYARSAPCVAYVGLRADEPERKGIYGDHVPQIFPMRLWGWTIADVRAYLHRRGIKVPPRTDCALCYDQQLGEWWELWRNYPAVYEQGVEQEASVGATFRSPSRDTWPASLAELRDRFEAGDIPRGVELNLDLFDDEPKRCRACTL